VIPPRVRRTAFWAYVPILFTGTHWPKVAIPGAGRPDLLIHVAAFGIWANLLIACGFFGRPTSLRNVAACWLIAAAFAGFDEATQAIPILYRTAGWDDWGANVLGITVGSLIALAWGRLRTPSADAAPRETPNL
jgi:VanZ family protein